MVERTFFAVSTGTLGPSNVKLMGFQVDCSRAFVDFPSLTSPNGTTWR